MKKNIIIASSVLVLAIITSVYFQVWQYINPEVLETYLEGFGIWTPIVYCAIYLVAVFIPYAGTTMTIVGGLLFPPLFGTALVITISSLGSVLPFLVSKKFGRKYIKAKIEKTKYKKYLDHTDKNSFMYVLYMRLLPLIPYELQNYIIGFVDISITKFIIVTFIGLLPGTFTLIYLGHTISDVQPIKLVILGILSLFAILLPLALKKFTKANEILEGKTGKEENKKERITKKKSKLQNLF